MDKERKKQLKEALSKVNATLKYYEADWISAQRAPEIERTRVTSFEEYVEIRLNNELSKIPELHENILKTSGHLFVCESLENINHVRHRFKKATISLNDAENFPEEEQEYVREILREAEDWLGGRRFTFNSVVERVKIVILKDDE